MLTSIRFKIEVRRAHDWSTEPSTREFQVEIPLEFVDEVPLAKIAGKQIAEALAEFSALTSLIPEIVEREDVAE